VEILEQKNIKQLILLKFMLTVSLLVSKGFIRAVLIQEALRLKQVWYT
jgi:hypothetical protein